MLESEGFLPDVYSLDGGDSSDTLCLAKRWIGWRVYYAERGERHDARSYLSESKACHELLRRLRKLPAHQVKYENAQP